jgi:hypothetical protein
VGLTKQLNLKDILNINDTVEQQVPTPEWGEGTFVVIRSMTGEARDAYEMSLFNSKNKEGTFQQDLSNARAKLIAACAVGPDGKRMFKTDAHVMALGNKSSAVIDRLFQACQALNDIGTAEIEELTGN